MTPSQPRAKFAQLRHSVGRGLDSLKGLGTQLTSVQAELHKLHEEVAALRASIDQLTRQEGPAGTSSREAWSSVAQEGELAFHERDRAFRGNEANWQRLIDQEWRSWGFSPDGWEGKTVVDVGAGSRLRSLWFTGSDILVIEPLGDRYMQQIEWSDLNQARAVYSVPGEEFVPEAEGAADLVMSINALDHGYSLEESFANIRRYLKPDGEAFVSIDMHDTVTDEMHPMVVKHEELLELFDRVGLRLVKSEEWYRRWHGAAGPKARNYWLKPAATTPAD